MWLRSRFEIPGRYGMKGGGSARDGIWEMRSVKRVYISLYAINRRLSS